MARKYFIKPGDCFNKWTVVKKADQKGRWVCQCECGEIRIILSALLINKKRKGCFNCVRKVKIKSGDKFGDWIAIELDKERSLRTKTTYWFFQCGCGTKISRLARKIINGDFKCCLKCKGEKNRGKKHYHWNGYGGIHGTFIGKIRRDAKKVGREFNITAEYIWELFIKQNRKCALSGVEIWFAKTSMNIGKDKNTASLDRIDSTKGYIEGNVQWVHKWVNIMKRNMTDDQFIDFCQKVVDYRRKI